MAIEPDIAKLQTMWDMCMSCAHEVYAIRKPSVAYARRVARLLFGTGCQESDGFRHTRQMGYSFTSIGGGHGHWQQQHLAIRDCIDRLRANKLLALNAGRWLFETYNPNPQWYLMSPVLQTTCISPRLSCLWARIYYLRDPDPVPDSVEDQAECWGQWYNTRREAKKNVQWVERYKKYTGRLGITAPLKGFHDETLL